MSLYHTLCVLLIFFSLCPGYTISQLRRRQPDLDGLLPNGLFEEVQLESERTVVNISDWQISGYIELVNSNVALPGEFNFSVAFEGNTVRLGNSASISQQVRVKRGLIYSLTFGAIRSCAQDRHIKVSVSGRSKNIPIQTMFSPDGGDSYAWAFKAMSDVVNVTLENPDLTLDRACGPLVNVVAIKEILPPTISILDIVIPFVPGIYLVKNGGFDIGPYVYTKYSTGVLIPANSEEEDSISPLGGWFVESPVPLKYIANRSFELSTRLPAVELMGGRESSISQFIPTLAGKTYILRFWVGDAHNDCHGQMMVTAFAGKESFNVSFMSEGKGNFKTDKKFYFAAASHSTKLTFYSVFNHTKHDSADLCGPVLDNVSVTPLGISF